MSCSSPSLSSSSSSTSSSLPVPRSLGSIIASPASKMIDVSVSLLCVSSYSYFSLFYLLFFSFDFSLLFFFYEYLQRLWFLYYLVTWVAILIIHF